MNILNVKQESREDIATRSKLFATTVTIEQDDSMCDLLIIHNQQRQITNWKSGSVNGKNCDLKFTNEQVMLLLHRAIEWLYGEKKYANTEVSEEEEEMFYAMQEKFLQHLHLHYINNSQTFAIEVKDTKKLYKELKYIMNLNK